MRNLSPVDDSNCALAEANIFEQAFWIGDVFVPEHYARAVSCDESEKWKLVMTVKNLHWSKKILLLLVKYRIWDSSLLKW